MNTGRCKDTDMSVSLIVTGREFGVPEVYQEQESTLAKKGEETRLGEKEVEVECEPRKAWATQG